MTGKPDDYGPWPVLFVVAFIVVGVVLLFREYDKTHACLEYKNQWVEEYSYINTGQKHMPTVTVPAHWAEECVKRGKPS